MDINYYKSLEPFFGSWKISNLIGEGSFGKVFEIEREDFGITYKAALKAITIPESPSEIEMLISEGMDEGSAKTYYKDCVIQTVQEFQLMSKLKGNSNIVSYEDHMVIEHTDDIGWDILIRMELLTPLMKHIKSHPMTERDIVKLGIDLCKSLELCESQNIIHRDIKPENIFISNAGEYKLGDLGVAKTIEKTSSGLSKKGTYSYMAPEVYVNKAYNKSVDIYSLGIVLYRLCNKQRTPFLPEYPAPISFTDKEESIAKRMRGDKIPAPCDASDALSSIILKACEYDANDRYSSASELKAELEKIYNAALEKTTNNIEDDEEEKTVSFRDNNNEMTVSLYDSGDEKTVSSYDVDNEKTISSYDKNDDKQDSSFNEPIKDTSESKEETKETKKSKKWIIIIILVVIVLTIIGYVISGNSKEKKETDNFIDNKTTDNITDNNKDTNNSTEQKTESVFSDEELKDISENGQFSHSDDNNTTSQEIDNTSHLLVVTSDKVNVRGAATADSEKVAELSKGETVKYDYIVTGYDGYSWYHIELDNGIVGFARSNLFRLYDYMD